jgi:hypothetical protein
MATGRLPDFVVIGTMKSGTTSLFSWLGAQPDCTLPAVKEPAFFSDDAAWAKGVDWYRSLFPEGGVTGEASVAYTSADATERAAERLFATVPGAKLVCLVRDPVERLRSHYVHERQRGREQRPFARAVTVDSPYATSSCYGRCLAPWRARAGDGQLLVVRTEDLSTTGWGAVLAHVGLPDAPVPHRAHNVTADKARFGRVARRFFDAGIRTPPTFVPGPARRLAKRALLRGPVDDDPLSIDARMAPIPDDVLAMLRADAAHA